MIAPVLTISDHQTGAFAGEIDLPHLAVGTRFSCFGVQNAELQAGHHSAEIGNRSLGILVAEGWSCAVWPELASSITSARP